MHQDRSQVGRRILRGAGTSRAASPSGKRRHAPGAAALLLALSLGVLACAPAANLRPIAPLGQGKYVELGAGYAARSPRLGGTGEPLWRHSAQTWVTGRPAPEAAPWLDLALVGAFELADTFRATVGLGIRFRIVEHERVAFGVGVELGVGWAAIDLPVAIKLVDGTWLYYAPVLETFPSLSEPLSLRNYFGLSVEVIDAFKVRMEAQHVIPKFDPALQHLNLGVGLAYEL